MNDFRKQNNTPPAVVLQRVLNDPAFQQRVEWAERRHEYLERLRWQRKSTRNKEARLNLYISEHFKVDGDEGFMDIEMFETLGLDRNLIEI